MHHIIEEDLANINKGIGKEARVLEGRTLLISGGAGFLGSYFVGAIHLLNRKFAKPCRVIVIDNYITGSKNSFIHELKDENIKLLEADITKPIKLEEPVHFIIHAAGLASPKYYKKFPLQTIDAAIFGAKNLLELARKNPVKSFLLFSSSEIYGDPDPSYIPTPEHYKGNVSCIGPRACYDESKRLTETLTITYHEVYGVPVKIVRPFNVYGPGMKLNDYRVIPNFFAKALSGESLPVYGFGNQTRTFCYVADAVIGFLKVLLLGKNGEVYNIGAEKPELNMVTLAHAVSGLFLGKVKVELISYPKSYPQDEPNRRCPDLTKAKTELGYSPTISLEEGLKRTLEWFKDEWFKDMKK